LAVDLLIMDEAAFIPGDIWTAARYSVIARRGSRVVACSTPYGRQDHWFAVTYRAGLPITRVEDHESFHWPSTASPLVDRELLDLWRKTSTDREYRAEVEADWVEDAGSYFSAAELEGSTTIDPVADPLNVGGRYAIAGVDWGFAHDASALALLEPDGDGYRVPYVEEAFNTPYATFVDRVTAVGDAWRGLSFKFSRVYSETNGVGAGPSQLLQARLIERRCGTSVTPVSTTAKSKEDTFGALKLLMQQGRLALPRFPPLLRQLAALEFSTTETGTVRISVPERAGHDDLAMALCIAATGMAERVARRPPDPSAQPMGAIPYADPPAYLGGFTEDWGRTDPPGVTRYRGAQRDPYVDEYGVRHIGVGGTNNGPAGW
jgi:hypothetical protein